ncbi:MAG: proline--tRNA ligase [bacterium]|nr:proline--tRNA ligase [bacterium]
MRMSQAFIPTLREDPKEAEVASHLLLLRAGMIRKLAAGIYSVLPLGKRVLRKVETIIREEMDRAGALELYLPAVQPAELWEESGRWAKYGKELLRFQDRHEHSFCFGPTHEEVITDLVRHEIRSYRDLPRCFYQIQVKFRDEVRPRFGLIRGREFIMKDAYSFDRDEAGAEQSYKLMVQAYERIFTRMSLDFRMVQAEAGNIGGNFSHEFMALADTGEDLILFCDACGYSASQERAEVGKTDPPSAGEEKEAPRERVATPGQRTVEEVCGFLKVEPRKLIKTLIVQAQGEPLAVLIRGDLEINLNKVKRHLQADSVELAEPETIERVTGAPVGFAGPVGLKLKILADQSIRGIARGVTGANAADFHFINVKVGRDFPEPEYGDFRLARGGDACGKCGKTMREMRGLELGHTFKLGVKYTQALQATYLDPEGKETLMVMGCYGIGVTRALAAIVEQSHDQDGIIFPLAVAPYQVIVVPVETADDQIREKAEEIYQKLTEAGLEVLLDDRSERAGAKFKDADLLGIPFRITIGKRNLAQGRVEIKRRGEKTAQLEPAEMACARITELVAAARAAEKPGDKTIDE